MNYEIRENAQFNSKEIYFTGKPSEEVRNALKALKFRWHGIKKCWYGFADERTIIDAILDTNSEESEEAATVTTDGYLGGGAIYGSKSRLGLYGQDLKKAIAADIKKAGIKGVTLSMNRGGSIYATINTQPEDLRPIEDYVNTYHISCGSGWNDVYYRNESGDVEYMSTGRFYNLTKDEQDKIRTAAAKFEYYKYSLSRANINKYCIDEYKNFSEIGLNKIKSVAAIIDAYRYDESNSMVDYFETNFYYNLITQPAKVRQEQNNTAKC